MLKAVFRPNELVTVKEKVMIETPTSFSELAHLAVAEEEVQPLDEIPEYKGPTADDLRREAEMFKERWEEEKRQMIADAKTEAENIINDAQNAAMNEARRIADEAMENKRKAQEQAESVIAEANKNAEEIVNEGKKNLDALNRNAMDAGFEEGRKSGYEDGKAELERLISRTQVMLERAQNTRSDVLSQTEKEIVDLVLLITRKVIKVITENQRNIITANVIEALRKVKSKGNINIRVNLNDLKIATEHKEEFIRLMEGASSINLIEDSTVDQGGCIIETDFGEIDARIASQLAELESKIIEISPIAAGKVKDTPVPIVKTANLNADLIATSSMLNAQPAAAEAPPEDGVFTDEDKKTGANFFGANDLPDDEKEAVANTALTASAALAALASLGMKGKRKTDKEIIQRINKGESPPPPSF